MPKYPTSVKKGQHIHLTRISSQETLPVGRTSISVLKIMQPLVSQIHTLEYLRTLFLTGSQNMAKMISTECHSCEQRPCWMHDDDVVLPPRDMTSKAEKKRISHYLRRQKQEWNELDNTSKKIINISYDTLVFQHKLSLGREKVKGKMLRGGGG